MAKPIILIEIPGGQAAVEEIKQKMFKIDDYHVICFVGEKFDFRVFYEKDYEEVSIEELKQMIKDSLKR